VKVLVRKTTIREIVVEMDRLPTITLDEVEAEFIDVDGAHITVLYDYERVPDE